MRTAILLLARIVGTIVSIPFLVLFAITYILAGLSLFILGSIKKGSVYEGMVVLQKFVDYGDTRIR